MSLFPRGKRLLSKSASKVISQFPISHPFNPFSTLTPEWSLFLGEKNAIIAHLNLKSFDGLPLLLPNSQARQTAFVTQSHPPILPGLLRPGPSASVCWVTGHACVACSLLCVFTLCSCCPDALSLYSSSSFKDQLIGHFICLHTNTTIVPSKSIAFSMLPGHRILFFALCLSVGVCLATKLRIVEGRALLLRLFIPRSQCTGTS